METEKRVLAEMVEKLNKKIDKGGWILVVISTDTRLHIFQQSIYERCKLEEDGLLLESMDGEIKLPFSYDEFQYSDNDLEVGCLLKYGDLKINILV